MSKYLKVLDFAVLILALGYVYSAVSVSLSNYINPITFGFNPYFFMGYILLRFVFSAYEIHFTKPPIYNYNFSLQRGDKND